MNIRSNAIRIDAQQLLFFVPLCFWIQSLRRLFFVFSCHWWEKNYKCQTDWGKWMKTVNKKQVYSNIVASSTGFYNHALAHIQHTYHTHSQFYFVASISKWKTTKKKTALIILFQRHNFMLVFFSALVHFCLFLSLHIALLLFFFCLFVVNSNKWALESLFFFKFLHSLFLFLLTPFFAQCVIVNHVNTWIRKVTLFKNNAFEFPELSLFQQ